MEEEEENYCYECQEDGHTNLTCPKIQCNNCNNYGHVKPRCPQLMGTTPPPGMNFDLKSLRFRRMKNYNYVCYLVSLLI